MQQQLSYRHRAITDDDLVFIRRLIAEHLGSSRRDLSKKLCVAWNWVQANGALRDMVCRVASRTTVSPHEALRPARRHQRRLTLHLRTVRVP